jgi:hypothetical protein
MTMRWIPLPTTVIVFLMTALPVLAQDASKAPAPKSTMGKPWASVVVAITLVLLVMLPSFIGSKRGHQD